MDIKIIRSDRKTVSLQIRDGCLIVKAPLNMSEKDIDAVVKKHERWIKNHTPSAGAPAAQKLTPDELRDLGQKALSVIPERVRFFAPKIGVSYGRITIRAQKTRWGSCSSKGNLNFNCLLMLAPPEVLDGVVVHELCHRKEMNHSDRFYAEVLRVLPDYREGEKWLKQNGSSLISRLP